MLGLLGGSGLYDSSFLNMKEEKIIRTPYGETSDTIQIGKTGDLTVVFLPRHGRKHTIPPHLVNHKANLWALKKIGVMHLISTSSSGSLKKEIKPGQFVVPDDFLCFWDIPTTLVSVHHPTPELDTELRDVLVRAATKSGTKVRKTGTYVQTLGPRLETKAEVRFFKSLGHILGMTMATEASIANELGIAYASLCSVDNYCNGIVPDPLKYDKIVEHQKKNASKLQDSVKAALEMLL